MSYVHMIPSMQYTKIQEDIDGVSIEILILGDPHIDVYSPCGRGAWVGGALLLGGR
jgi:hypothetical protein